MYYPAYSALAQTEPQSVSILWYLIGGGLGAVVGMVAAEALDKPEADSALAVAGAVVGMAPAFLLDVKRQGRVF